MRVVVPFAAEDPKTRLSSVLDEAERSAFARVMLTDVIKALTATGHDPEVLATAPMDLDVPVVVDDRSLTPAVNAYLTDTTRPCAIVMADLPLVTPTALKGLFRAPGDIVIAPGRGGGTNAIVTRHPEFRVDYHGTSYLDHLAIAYRLGATVSEVDSHRLATDIDERSDLAEILVLGDARTRDWLADHGFELTVTDGRVTVTRP